MKGSTLMAIGAVLAASAAWAADVEYYPSNAPNGTHLQSGSPGCTESGYTVTCNSYDLAGVGNKNATALLSVTYRGTVLCKNPAGNVAPGQTGYPDIKESTPLIEPKNGRMTVPELESASLEEIVAALEEKTTCPNRKWTKSVVVDSIAIVGYTYTLTFQGYKDPYIIISG